MPEIIGVYVHWPFCQAKCPYCDFNSHVVASVDQRAWAAAYEAEITRYAALQKDAIVGSIFFGGGTPSLMAPETVAAVIDGVRRAWPTVNDLEITLEANPTSVEANRFTGYAAAGVNRISMGIQALNDRDLKALGRLHSVAEARTAFDLARATFDRVSFDLIYARQHQTVADWRQELGEALSMAADHLSLYQLTIENGTAFGARHARGLLRGLPGEDLGADLWDVTQEMCAAAGMPGYEISNHAVPGAESRHNLVYWSGRPYVGIGPGAHGRLSVSGRRIATEAVSQPGAWLAKVRSGERPDTEETLSQAETLEERLMMGLRIREGVERSVLDELGISDARAAGLVDLGMLEVGARVRLTEAGRPLLDGILRELLA